MTPSVHDISSWFSRRFPGQTPAPAGTGGAEVQPASPGAPAAPREPGVETKDYAARGVHVEVRVPPSEVVGAATFLDQLGFALDTLTGVDWMAENEMEVIYDYFHPAGHLRVAVRTRVPRACPEVPTVTSVFAGANWHERETHEFFGIRFSGHPNLTPLLLPEDAQYHPLRKDFAA